MYLVVKQQLNHLSKVEYNVLKEQCHISKNLKNQVLYELRKSNVVSLSGLYSRGELNTPVRIRVIKN